MHEGDAVCTITHFVILSCEMQRIYFYTIPFLNLLMSCHCSRERVLKIKRKFAWFFSRANMETECRAFVTDLLTLNLSLSKIIDCYIRRVMLWLSCYPLHNYWYWVIYTINLCCKNWTFRKLEFLHSKYTPHLPWCIRCGLFGRDNMHSQLNGQEAFCANNTTSACKWMACTWYNIYMYARDMYMWVYVI